ncbi:PP2C family protein-serine/threonine phosphatase [Bradyrhizobium diazoefficiens]|uniref:PP2C family protein-serine/threonine phosphatase n=1 Tax=Bradyrhizobium diazoefficiens TaxID=1355477 RepID=UPI002729B6D9|nr:PP2C family serine/threonine-protein phosphatase [Bradyrhizobium diazoefficiens]WLA68598.1 serine/threonine-protein phosphatase [Bradyrhizobium diazoefficiens]
MIVDYAHFSDQGPRPDNEDSDGLWLLPDGAAMAVADGLGGHIGGQFASRLAIDTFISAMREGSDLDLAMLAWQIHQRIRQAQADKPELRRMATTFSAIRIAGHNMRLVHCGDTRIVLQRRKGIKLLTQDHTEAQRLLSIGKISAEEFDHYPRKNILESALGGPTHPKIDSASLEVLPGDRVFITSDGVHGKVFLRELKALSDNAPTATVFVQAVADLVRQRGADDNYTIAAAFLS